MTWKCTNCGALVFDGAIHGCQDVAYTMPQQNFNLPVTADAQVSAADAASAVAMDVAADVIAQTQNTADDVQTSAPVMTA